ncbi:MAG: hypothetical protein AB8F34_02365 [Akkermansiaceae bacterium]
MNAREEKRAAFNEQMNEWVSRQGFWFQLRHAADGQSIAARFLRLLIRLSVVVVICCLLIWLYLVKRVETEGFQSNVATAIEKSLAAESCEVGVIRKSRDMITISTIKAEGSSSSFFHEMSARVARVNMGLTDGIIGKWSTETVNVDQLILKVKAGESDDDAAAKSFASLFAELEGFDFERLMVDRASIEWGYSETNRGSISNSSMSVVRDEGAWNIQFRGGTFSQNWLKNLEIESLAIVCDQQGVHVKEAILHSGLGTVTFQLKIGSGAQPQAKGELKLTSMPLKALIPVRYDEWLEGTISGEGTIGGSTNSQEGIVLDVNFFMGEGDVMVLRDRLPLLSALSVVDLYNSYRKVSFNKGGFNLRTAGDLVNIKDIDIQAGTLLHLKGGEFVVRPPTNQEIANALNIKDIEMVADVIENKWKFESDELLKGSQEAGLDDAAKGVGKVVQGNEAGSDQIKNVITAGILTESKVQRFGGNINLSLKRDAFDKAEKLKLKYPVDENEGRIRVGVPLEGRLQSLTLKQAQEFYILGKNRL